MTHDGDGTWSAVDPDNSDIVFERQPAGQAREEHRRRQELDGPDEAVRHVPVRQPVLDGSGARRRTCSTPATRSGSRPTPARPGRASFTLGTSPAGVAYAMSAIDLRSERYGPPLPTGPHTAGLHVLGRRHDGSGRPVAAPWTSPAPTPTTRSRSARPRAMLASNVEDHLDESRPRLGSLPLPPGRGRSRPGRPLRGLQRRDRCRRRSRSRWPNPVAGNYIIRVVNSTRVGHVRRERPPSSSGRRPSRRGCRTIAYVGFCGTCDALNARPFDNGIATTDAPLDRGWHRATAHGLPKRFITSVMSDPTNPKHGVRHARRATRAAGWFRARWARAATSARATSSSRPTPASTSRTSAATCPDGPAESTVVYGGNLIVGTDNGVFTSRARTAGRTRCSARACRTSRSSRWG